MKNANYMKLEWDGINVRFVRKGGEWFLILKDLSDALGIRYEDARSYANWWHRVRVDIAGGWTLGVDCGGMYSVASRTPYVEDDSDLLSWLDMVFYYLRASDRGDDIPVPMSENIRCCRKVVHYE